MSKVLYENDLYIVSIVEDALAEDGKSECTGYGVFNKETKVREATFLVYPEARWRADTYANAIRDMDEKAEAEDDPLAEAAAESTDDVTLN